MNIEKEIKKLKDNRFMRTNEEFELFEEALANVGDYGNIQNIKDLCDVLFDDTEFYEVMYGIIHTIDYLGENSIEESLFIQGKTIPSMLPQASEWAKILQCRILNHDEYRKIYGKILLDLDIETRKTIIKLLKDIKNENLVLFERKVNEIINF
ncbi:Imm30 family immunity protein [Tepidibacter hydrothermalis]|uniref:Imm30 family immunity protein n=1 Tax=Tepidibacter hydrothermalis TaxID=3036126 RepID=A0ABY8EKV6_9FIRM|nr:Imm30 family immunity protein [Tepidibacter hydrothermalis]WFD11940.1 Imm30 family immunity protein [Tepidibacter hydrothermalis]